MNWTSNVGDWIVVITKVSVGLLTLSIVWGILFGNTVPFLGANVINNIAGIVSTLGSQGLVGLITVGIIAWLFTNHDDD